ncbi:TerD family protein [Clostridium sporogenes]|uniref:TerD family protein n=1 Tax=Clostridium TaxID=1485 RepID=UPI0005F96D57|nr:MULTISPECIES: TerD family protein [Clostridium]MDU1419613.1 TerD family protein [Clostridium botulinum]MCF4015901.1 TerD family protein [Clostridium sporogenes]MDU7253025.1 TerD family protein [Clostridium sp.]SUY64407.1 tellurium resistance protein terE [Clostridium sporogenes]HDK7167825.1 TerD family protein [Clostridium botulinum]
MSINLKKGQRISLTKENSGLSKVMVGLGWDAVGQSGAKGLLGGLFGKGGQSDIDCDASVIMLDENDRVKDKGNIIYFGNLKSKDGSVKHMGDNLTGDGDGDDEQIMVDLTRVPSSIHKLVFIVNIYNCVKRNQHFGMIKNAFIRIVNMTGNKEILRFNLTDEYSNKTGLFVGEIYRHGSEWKFAAIGEGSTAKGINDMVERYR